MVLEVIISSTWFPFFTQRHLAAVSSQILLLHLHPQTCPQAPRVLKEVQAIGHGLSRIVFILKDIAC